MLSVVMTLFVVSGLPLSEEAESPGLIMIWAICSLIFLIPPFLIGVLLQIEKLRYYWMKGKGIFIALMILGFVMFALPLLINSLSSWVSVVGTLLALSVFYNIGKMKSQPVVSEQRR